MTIPAAPGLEVKEVSFAYPNAECLFEELSFEIHPGQIVSVLGPSGCGKSTLLRLIAGLERVQRGTIIISGRCVSAPGVAVKPEHRRVGLVFQDGALFPHLSVARNVSYGIRAPRRNRHIQAQEMLDFVGIADLRDRMPSTLSGGQQQRVALARALASEPEVVLLDEPFSNLDDDVRLRLRSDTARLLRARNVATLLVTHDRGEAEELSDSMVSLNKE